MTPPIWSRRHILAGLATLTLARRAGAAPRFAHSLDVARGIEQLHALVIARNGRIAEAQAFRGAALGQPVNVKSVSKSLISALTGIAVARGEITTDTAIAAYLKRDMPRRADPRLRDITVGHLLSMQSGLQEVSGATYGEWVASRRWIYNTLSRPMIADPGTAMLYSTANYHILGAVLSAVAGRDLHAVATARLGDPLGIHLPQWARDPQRRFVGGNDMYLSPLAMVRFGEMYRRGGLRDGHRILTADWITRSWTPYGNSDETGHGYGYGWFIWSAAGQDIYYARGYGGQMIYIVPALALTVVITSATDLPATIDGHLGVLNRLLTDYILPAAAS